MFGTLQPLRHKDLRMRCRPEVTMRPVEICCLVSLASEKESGLMRTGRVRFVIARSVLVIVRALLMLLSCVGRVQEASSMYETNSDNIKHWLFNPYHWRIYFVSGEEEREPSLSHLLEEFTISARQLLHIAVTLFDSRFIPYYSCS
jgi:hypothetical protein